MLLTVVVFTVSLCLQLGCHASALYNVTTRAPNTSNSASYGGLRNDSVIFHESTTAATSAPRKCNGELLEIWWPPTMKCEQLTDRGPCGEGEWLILNPGTREPTCKKRPCPYDKLLSGGQCKGYRDPRACPEGMQLYQFEFEEASCDCRPGLVYWLQERKCYPVYRQGPCKNGQLLILESNSANVRCARNPCRRGFVTARGGCHKLKEPGPCESGVLDVNEETLQVDCVQDIHFNYLIDAPLRSCPPGSRRDIIGLCRQLFEVIEDDDESPFGFA